MFRASKTCSIVSSGCAHWVPNSSTSHGKYNQNQGRIDANESHRNAGGRTSELTSELVKTCQKLIGIETCMHLTCTGMPKEKVDVALRVSSPTLHSISHTVSHRALVLGEFVLSLSQQGGMRATW